MSPRPPHADILRRARGWLIPGALFALTPKCVVCLLAYAGLGAAVRFGGPELCGATDNAPGHWTTWMLVAGVMLGLAGIFHHSRRLA